jgi:multiple sugar transport system ATP-binding protein
MAEVRLEHIYKTYKGEVEAVKDLNLAINDGEFLALLGPSGCGKTSTLRMIVGLEEITAGKIFIGNRVVNNVEAKDRDVALAFETYALYPPLTIKENIAFCLRAKGVKSQEVERRVKEVAELLDITDILDRKPGELGGGQKQRVSLARALIREPAVFLMDEPLSHLDAKQRAHMRTELKRLHAEIKKTTILVTHDQLEAIAMAERIAVMNFGVLQQVGSVDEIYNHPANEFVAGFVGEPPMNMIRCDVFSQGGDLFVRASDGSFERKLPDALKERITAKNPKQVDLGIRPINMEVLTAPADDGRLELNGTVFAYENLGEEGELTATVGKNTLVAVTPPGMKLVENQSIWLHMKSRVIHLFDAETELAL